MDSFFKGFNLSNILRQLLCGVVFFVPFILFRWDQVEGLLLHKNADNLWIPFILVATCIGTLIYHVEKNLLGYASQVFRSWCKKCNLALPPVIALGGMLVAAGFLIIEIIPYDITRSWIFYSLWIACLIISFAFSARITPNEKHSKMIKKSSYLIYLILCSACLICTRFLDCKWVAQFLSLETLTLILSYGALIFLPTFLIFSAIFSKHTVENPDKGNCVDNAFDLTVEETRNTWIAAPESKLSSNTAKDNKSTITQDQEQPTTNTILAIAQRESGWADFIHCAQTSAVAWILGSYTAYNLTCTNKLTNPQFFKIGILLAIWLLFFEFFCEWHKSLHIDYMLKEYGDIKKQLIQQSTSSAKSSLNK